MENIDIKLKYDKKNIVADAIESVIGKYSKKISNDRITLQIREEFVKTKNSFGSTSITTVKAYEYGIGSHKIELTHKNDKMNASLTYDENNHDNGIVEYSVINDLTVNNGDMEREYTHSCTGAYSFYEYVTPRIVETINNRVDDTYERLVAKYNDSLIELEHSELTHEHGIFDDLVTVDSKNNVYRKISNEGKVSYSKSILPENLSSISANDGALYAQKLIDSLDFIKIDELEYSEKIAEIMASRAVMLSSEEGRVGESR